MLQNIPNRLKTGIWTVTQFKIQNIDMQSITAEEIKEIQLNILKAVHKFCIDNDINYSLAYGTLIGAVRHRGFIPWDDDIDIMMPRKDYDIFIDKFQHNLYKVYSAPKTPEYRLTYAKVIDIKTDLKEKTSLKLHLGVNIDVFPIDNVSDDIKELEQWYTKKKYLEKIYNAKLLPLSIKHPRGLLTQIKYSLLNPYLTMKRLGLAIQKEAIAFNNESCHSVAMLSSPRTNINHVFPKSIMNEYINIEFEGLSFKSIKDYDRFLDIMYGNWRELPPLEEQRTHHSFVAYWK